MSQRLNDYFASEATEYLDQLERLLTLPGKPDVDQLLRLSTGVRGSAQMAGADTVAGVAERLEDAARSIVSSNVAWSEEIRELSRQTVGDLKLLVRALNRWGEEEESRVREAILRWEDLEEAAGAAKQAVPVSALFYDDGGTHILDEPSARGADQERTAQRELHEAVPIDTLLLRGEGALRAALALRSDFERALGGDATDRPLFDLADEIFDLIQLGLDEEPPEA
ncbi:MAG: Hpt domain-containing protein [Gemmatimonadota bacterium]